MTGDGSISEASAAGFTDYGGGPGQTTGSDTSASGGSDPFDYDRFYDQYQYAGVTPDTGLAELGVSTPAYGRSGMDFNRALDALIGMQAYPYIPPEPSLNIAGIRGIPSAGMLAEDPVYGFREPVTAHPVDRPTGFFDRYSQDGYDYPAPVAPGGTRSLAPVAGTPPTPSYSTVEGDYGQNIFSILDQGITGMQTGTSGRGQLDALSAAGLGNMPGMNPNNPTQTVDQLINSYRANNFLEKYAPTIFGAATGFGPHLNAIRMGADVLSGKATPGQVLTGLGLDYIAGKAGLPGGGPVLGDLLEGRVDRAASGATQRGLAALLGSALGVPAPIANIALQETGLGPKAGAAVGNAIGPSQPTGATSSLAQLFDKGFDGIKSLFSGVPQGGAGTAPTAQTAGVPTYEYAGDQMPTASAAPAASAAPTAPEVQAAQRLLYGLAQGPYGPLLAYDIGGRG